MSDITRQLDIELSRALVTPVTALCGDDLGSKVERRIDMHAEHIAGLLAAETHSGSAPTAINILNALWPNCEPEECGRADWWRTPLGLTCAEHIGTSTHRGMTRATAAAVLGVTPGTIAQLTARGHLGKLAGGKIDSADVFRRLVRLHAAKVVDRDRPNVEGSAAMGDNRPEVAG